MEERLFVFHPGDGGPPVRLTEDNGFSVEADTTRGLLGGAWRVATSTVPGEPGRRIDSVVRDASEPQLGMLVRAKNRAEFQDRVRGLVAAMLPSRGVGRLSVTTLRTGETRSLLVQPLGPGLEGDEDDQTLMPGRWWRCIIHFLAPEGAWRGAEVTHAWKLASPIRRPWFPLLGARIAARSIGGRRQLNNPSNFEVFSPWVVTGPGEELALIHHGLGKEFRIVHDIPADGPGSTITIHMGRGRQLVADGYAAPGTGNLFHTVTSDPEGWALQPGVNDVEVVLIGSGETSSVSTTYEPLLATS